MAWFRVDNEGWCLVWSSEQSEGLPGSQVLVPAFSKTVVHLSLLFFEPLTLLWRACVKPDAQDPEAVLVSGGEGFR